METENLALIVSIISAVISAISAAVARSSTKKANGIALQNLNLSHAMMELEIRTSIESSKSKLSDLAITMAPLLAKEKTGSIGEEDKITLDVHDKILKSATQTMLNMYEDGCAKYLDEKIDKDRFKKTYQVEIRNLLEANELKKYFDPHSSRYKAIIKVYSDWENLEK